MFVTTAMKAHINCVDLVPLDKLEGILSMKATLKKQRAAVLRIQKAVRGFLAKKKYHALLQKRYEAARYIQRIWKRYRMVTMVPKAWRKFKYDRITRVQKFIRGYLVFKRYFTEINDKKLKENFEFFDKIKGNLLLNSQIKIR